MSFLKDIEKIKSKTLLLGLFDILFFVLPGVLFLFIFQRNIFLSIDWVKLLSLSASITAPLILLNILFVSTYEPIRPGDNDEFFLCFTQGVIITGLILFMALFISYITSIGPKGFFLCLASFEIIFMAAEKSQAKKRLKKITENK